MTDTLRERIRDAIGLATFSKFTDEATDAVLDVLRAQPNPQQCAQEYVWPDGYRIIFVGDTLASLTKDTEGADEAQ